MHVKACASTSLADSPCGARTSSRIAAFSAIASASCLFAAALSASPPPEMPPASRDEAREDDAEPPAPAGGAVGVGAAAGAGAGAVGAGVAEAGARAAAGAGAAAAATKGEAGCDSAHRDGVAGWLPITLKAAAGASVGAEMGARET